MRKHPYYSQAQLVRDLRSINNARDKRPVFEEASCVVDKRGVIMFDEEHAHEPLRHREAIPGTPSFDAVGAARRILAAWRDAPRDISVGHVKRKGGYHD